MKKFKDWANGLVTEIGSKSPLQRKTVAKLSAALAIGAMIVSHGNLFPGGDDGLQKDKPVSFYQLKDLMDDNSKHLSSIYGSDTKIIISHNDKNLREIVEKLEPNHFKDYSSHSGLGLFSASWDTLVKKATGFDISVEDTNKQKFVGDLNSWFSGPGALSLQLDEKGVNGEKLSVAFMRDEIGWLSPDLDNLESARFPYVIDKSVQNAYSFMHEMTHALDDDEGKPSIEHGSLQRESVADVGFALVAMREMGSLDAYINYVRPFRLSNARDDEHMTIDIADEALAQVSMSDVLGKTDAELMRYAQTIVNSTTQIMFENVHETSEGKSFNDMAFNVNKYTGYALSDKRKCVAARHNLDEMTEGGGRETLMDFSRLAMNASLQNLIYTDSLESYGGKFISSVERHIKYWGDDLAKDALTKSSQSGRFDVAVFANEMGFEISHNSGVRPEQVAKLERYYQSVVSADPMQGLNLTTLEPQNDKMPYKGASRIIPGMGL